ncbi:phage major capsid protein [Mesorhizobium sp. M1409]|uniref:phage major capsid protein n=1 Tax=Mesorhizobium sp. M1409 TaxID=2957100 RepID=UPI00333593E5
MPEPTVNQLVATTINNYHKEFADNVSNSNAVTAMLRQGDRIRVIDGGKAISTPLTYAEETFAWYVGTELLSRAVKETISEADYEPANAVASVTLSGPDLAKNRGRERILNLLEGKLDNAEATMKNNITKAVYGDGTVAKSFAGLKAFVTNDGTGTVGGIDSATWAFWRNQFQPIARNAGTLEFAAVKAGINALWMKLVRGTEHPDLVLADAEIYSTYESGLQDNQRYADARLGALGFETLKYKQAALTFDGAATGLVGGYMLNTKYLKFEVYSGRNFEPLDLPDQSPDMDAVTRHIAFMGGLTLSNRAMQGRILLTG